MPRSQTKETRKKISASLAQYHARERRRKELSLANQPKDATIAQVSIVDSRDRWVTNFLNLDAGRIASILDRPRVGLLREWAEFAEAMVDSDPQLKALIQKRIHALSGVDLRIEPFDESEEAKEAADFVKRIIDGIKHWDRTIRRFLFAEMNGLSVGEIMWERHRDGYYSISEILPVHTKKWRIDIVDGRWKYLLEDSETGELIDVEAEYPGKFVLHSPGDEIDPAKRGILRSVAYYFFFKKLGIAYWLGGAEKFSFPAIYAKVPPETAEHVRTNLVEHLKQLVSDNAAVFDSEISIETVDASSSSGGDAIWKSLLNFFNGEMAKVIIGGTLNIDVQSTGANRALGEVHAETTKALLRADANALAETLRHYLIKPLLDFNAHLFSSPPPMPRIWFDVERQEYEPIQEWHARAGIVSVNEIRADLGQAPRTKEQGGEASPVFPDAQPQPGQEPALNGILEPANDNGEGGSESSDPLASKGENSSSETSSHLMKAIERKLSVL